MLIRQNLYIVAGQEVWPYKAELVPFARGAEYGKDWLLVAAPNADAARRAGQTGIAENLPEGTILVDARLRLQANGSNG